MDVESYRDEHESDEHWQLRRAFLDRWKNDYPEDRLLCLARVFVNMELLGCRYPVEVMQEVSRLSYDVAQAYRKSRKNKLQRTFVSASVAAEDRARGVKREGGVVRDNTPSNSKRIAFVRQGQFETTDTADTDTVETHNSDDDLEFVKESSNERTEVEMDEPKPSQIQPKVNANEYIEEMANVKCLNVRSFCETMFQTEFGRLVLLIRPWSSKLCNIYSSCQLCNIPLTVTYESNLCTLNMNGQLLAQATGASKAEARSIVEVMAWNRLKQQVVSVLVKQQWIAQGSAPISVNDVASKGDQFGTPVEPSVASKMMKLMGWQGGGLGAGAQGIAEPIKPNLQMVNRAGLGSQTSDIRQLRREAASLMRRYIASDALDLDLVFSSEFSKDERAALHQCAQRAGLASRSYGTGDDRFLVVKRKLDPFSLVLAVLEHGGDTPKYQVYVPAALGAGAGGGR